MNFFVYFIKRQFLRQLLAVFILFLFAQSYSFSQQPEQIQLEPSILLGLEQNNSFSDKNLSSTDIISLALEYSLCPFLGWLGAFYLSPLSSFSFFSLSLVSLSAILGFRFLSLSLSPCSFGYWALTRQRPWGPSPIPASWLSWLRRASTSSRGRRR